MARRTSHGSSSRDFQADARTWTGDPFITNAILEPNLGRVSAILSIVRYVEVRALTHSTNASSDSVLAASASITSAVSSCPPLG